MYGSGTHASAIAGQQGWASWAWSYVPQIMPSSGSTDDLSQLSNEKTMLKKMDVTILDIGVYVMKASVVFKVSLIMNYFFCCVVISGIVVYVYGC